MTETGQEQTLDSWAELTKKNMMNVLNPELNFEQELASLRETYAVALPKSRLNVIRQRLSQVEIGATRLVTTVSAVEALARSLLVHAQLSSSEDAISVYNRHRRIMPVELIKQLFKVKNLPEPNAYFGGQAWGQFLFAVEFRNIVVHECTYLGQDKYTSLIAATEEVLEKLVNI